MNGIILLSILAGFMFSVGGVAYKIGANGNVRPIQCAVFLSAVGTAVFGLLGWNEWANCTLPALLIGTVIGFTQYWVIVFLRWALQLGPLSPAWCAVSLAFIPVIIYSAFSCGEKISACQFFSIAATVGAIISASFSSHGGKGNASWKQKSIYCLILVLLLVFNSTMSVGLKYASQLQVPGTQVPLSEQCGNVILCLVYFMILVCGVIDFTCGKKWVFNRHAFLGGGLLALGASSGYGLQLYLVGKASAVIVFALGNTVSILGAALISVLILREKITKSWYFTIGFSILAILLNR